MLALALALTLATPPDVFHGTIARPRVWDGWIEIDVGASHTFFFTLGAGVHCPDLHAGDRVRFVSGADQVIMGIEVASPAPGAMEVAVEEWVMQCRGARAWKALDASDLAELDRLGSLCYQIREGASRRLRARRGGALRALTWARRSGDPEVRMRAGVLLAELGASP